MDKLKTPIQQVSNYLSRFKKQDKNRGSPKLIKTTRKSINALVLTELGYLIFIGASGYLRTITFSSKVTSLEKEGKKAHPPSG